MTFYTAIDLWVGVLLLVGVIVVLGAIPKALAYESKLLKVGSISILVGSIALMISTPFTRYEIDNANLLVKAWPLHSDEIPIDHIYSVNSTRDPKSAPALSLDRLKVSYRGGTVMISPRDRDIFCSVLREKNRNITCS